MCGQCWVFEQEMKTFEESSAGSLLMSAFSIHSSAVHSVGSIEILASCQLKCILKSIMFPNSCHKCEYFWLSHSVHRRIFIHLQSATWRLLTSDLSEQFLCHCLGHSNCYGWNTNDWLKLDRCGEHVVSSSAFALRSQMDMLTYPTIQSLMWESSSHRGHFFLYK